MDAKILEEIGLTKSETNVYLALLELGSSSTGKIVDKSGAASSKVYEILDRLMQKGLVSFIIKSGVKYFEAAPPERIMDYMEEKEKAFNEQKTELKKILPELELKQKLAKYKSEATIFKGLKGGETAFKHMINSMNKEDEWIAFIVTFTNKRYFDLITKLHRWRAEKGLKSRIIYNERHKKEVNERETIPLSKIKYVHDEMQTPVIVNVAGNITLINTMTEEITVFMIESKEVADSFRTQFEKLWNQETFTYEGVEAIKSLFKQMLEFGDYDVFAEGMKIVDVLGEDFFTWWQEEKRKKGINARGIIGSKYKDAPTVTKATTDFKLIPGYENPGLTYISKDKTATIVLKEKPTAFLINNKEVADANRTYFDLLWNKDVLVHKGFEEVTNRFKSILDECTKEGYYVLGATYGEQKDKLWEWFLDYHGARLKKEIPVQLLCVSKDFKAINEQMIKAGDINLKLSQVRTLSQEFSSPMQINLYPPNKVLMFMWGKKFMCFEIESDLIYKNFKTYFDKLWDQKIETYEGQENVQFCYGSLIENASPHEEVVVFAAKPTTKEGADYNVMWNRKMRRKVKDVKLLFQGYSRENIDRAKEIAREGCTTKVIHSQEKVPISTVISGNIVLNSVWGGNPITFKIDNKEVADSLRANFRMLWNQDSRIVKGLDAIQGIFEDMLESGSCDLIAAKGYFVDHRPKYIDGWEQRAIKKGFKMRNIVDPETKGHRITKFPFAKTKYTLEKEFANLSVFWIYGDKVVISNWTEKEPMATIIENKNMYELYKKQFELLWNK